MTFRTLATGAALAAVAAGGCGGSSISGSSGGGSAPDVTGGPASSQATLFKAANLQRVLTQVKGRLTAGEGLTAVKIEPRDVKVVGSTQVVTVDSKGHALTVVTPPIPQTGGSVAITDIDPAVVERVAAKAATAAHKTLADVAYVAVSSDPITKKASLGIYMTDSSYYSTSITGTGFKAHASGASSSAPTPSAAAAAPAATSAPASASGGGGTVIDPQKIAACVQNAGSDAAKVQACTGH